MISSILSTGLLAMISIARVSNAHLVMKTPVPFGQGSLNNSPLNDAAIGSAGSDFPCKQRPGVYQISQMNEMPVGKNQTLSFTGSASHGGGTCQLAVSLDKEPTASSTWKIIQVYQGGCPITAEGNAGTDEFNFAIPDKFPNGQATLAWTWFNRIGNREMYMNCAPIMVSGGSDNQEYYNTLPDMYVINLPTSQCKSVEGSDQIIPNPGQFIVKGNPNGKAASATGPACDAAAAAQTNGVKGYQAAPADNGAGAASGDSAATQPSAAPAQTYNNGLYTPQAGAQVPAAAATPNAQAAAPSASGMTTSVLSLAVVAPTSAVAAVPTNAPSTEPAANAGNGTGSSPDSSSGTTQGTSSGSSCSPDGAIVCNGDSQFGLCNWGQVVWQDVAAGTTCSNGVIARKLGRRDSVHFRAHFRAAHS